MITNGAAAMSSRKIAEITNKRHDNVKRTIETLADQGTIIRPQIEDEQVFDTMGRARAEKVYMVGERDSYVVVAQLSPEFTAGLVDYWQQHRDQPVRQLSTTETLIQMLQIQAGIERLQSEHGQAIADLNSEVTEIRRAHSILEKMPTDCEGIEHVRKRMNKEYTLSVPVVDKIMRDSPFAPTVRVLVRNTHAEGVHNSGFSKKEVSAIFRRFVAECQHSSGALHTHPYIEGRFRLIKRE